MLAAIKTDNPKEIILKEKPIPELNNDEVLVKVDGCGVCGSDLHAYNHSRGYEFVKTPLILGHEISGEVVETFNKKENNLIGKKVIIESMHYCGECDNCKDGRFSICMNNKVIGLHYNGGMAEYVKTKRKYIKVISDELSPKLASLSEPMAVAVHAVEKVGDIRNKTVLVQGPGIIGFFVGLACIEKGAKVVISGLEKDYKSRLIQAEKFGMTPFVTDKDYLTQKMDVLFECSGSSNAISAGFKNLEKGGLSVFVALYEQSVNLFLTDLVRNEWPIITSYGSDPKDYSQAFDLLIKNHKKLENIITYYPLSNVTQAFEDSLNQKTLKSVLLLNE